MDPDSDTHGQIMPTGKHQGERFTRIPVGYLRWMVRSQHHLAETALAELKRRGTSLPDVEVTAHALDRASLYCLEVWQQDCYEGEGLHTWLARIAKESLSQGLPDGEKLLHKGMKLVIATEGTWPVLVTVMPNG